MRTISADNEAILQAGARAVQLRFSVKDAGGTLRDLSTYPGVDLVEDLSWGEDLNAEGVTWSATLTREQRSISLAPLMSNSPLNRGFDPAASYAALLQVGRQMQLEYSLQAYGDSRSRTWALAFAGYIDTVDSGAGDTVRLTGRGLEAALINTFIERERVYAYAQGANATKGCYVWPDASKGTAYTTFAVGDRVIPTDSKVNGHFYRATSITTGIVAATEPTWPTGGGSTVVDGGVTWTESGSTSTSTGTPVETVMQQLLDDNGTGVTLDVPVSPGWDVVWFLIDRQSLFAELKALADQIGWCLRYKYSGTSTSKLTLYDPNRTTTTSLRTFTPSQYEDPSRVAADWKDIRNAVRVVYSDSQDLDAAGNPKRKAVVHTDSTSITKYTRLFCELAEDSTGNIDTGAEADALAVAVLSDLSEPTADMQIPLLFFFAFVEVADLVTFGADGVRFDTDQKLAVSSYQHSYSATLAGTSIRVRGKPASNSAAGWASRMSDAEGGESHQLTSLENLAPFSIAADVTPVGGARLEFDWEAPKTPRDVLFEVHLSEVTGFTPDSTTLVQTSKARSAELGNLDPAKTYYSKVIPVVWNGQKPVRGQPSPQTSFVPGRAAATHLNPNVDWGRFPLNGGFETQFDPSVAPDFWTNGLLGGIGDSGTWGVNTFLLADANGCSGANYIQGITTGTTHGAGLTSAEFSINEFETYKLSGWRKTVAGTGSNAMFGVIWFDYLHGAITAPTTVFSLTTSVGTWVKEVSGVLTPPGGARFARAFIFINPGAAGRECHFDDVRLTMQ